MGSLLGGDWFILGLLGGACLMAGVGGLFHGSALLLLSLLRLGGGA